MNATSPSEAIEDIEQQVQVTAIHLGKMISQLNDIVCRVGGDEQRLLIARQRMLTFARRELLDPAV